MDKQEKIIGRLKEQSLIKEYMISSKAVDVGAGFIPALLCHILHQRNNMVNINDFDYIFGVRAGINPAPTVSGLVFSVVDALYPFLTALATSLVTTAHVEDHLHAYPYDDDH